MKKIFQRIPAVIRYLFANFIILFFEVLLFRLAFYLFFMESAVKDQGILFRAWLTGGAFDLRLVMLILFPVFLLIVFCGNTFFQRKKLKSGLLIYFSIIDLCLLVLYLLDLNNYTYFGTRLDPHFFLFFNGVLFWQTFPVVKECALVIVLMYILYRLHYAAYKRFSTTGEHILLLKRRWISYVLACLLMAIGIFGIYNGGSGGPLRESATVHFPDKGVQSLSLNPALHLIAHL